MRNKVLVRKCLSIVCLLATGLCANLVLADWTGNKSQSRYNPGYGDFPPKNINELFKQDLSNSEKQQGESKSPVNKMADTTGVAQPADTSAVKSPSVLNAQPVNPGSYDPSRNADAFSSGPIGRNPMYDRGTNFNAPWNNSRSGFTGPWNNNGSSFSGPWNNRGSGFSAPWGNNGSGFSGPWNNNGSNISGPWNNGSNFSPWGNNGGWR